MSSFVDLSNLRLLDIETGITIEEFLKGNMYYLQPYYKYSDVKDYPYEKDFTTKVLKLKDGDVSTIYRFADKVDSLIPNIPLVLCFVPSSTASKKYYEKVWDGTSYQLDLSKSINPPLADLIYILTSGGNSFDATRSAENYSKFEDSLRIDGSTVLCRRLSVDAAHAGGQRSIKIHTDSICVKNAHLIKDKDVILIDDVITTGCSMKACELLLKKNGARNVYWLAIGHTTHFSEDVVNDEEDLPF